MFGIFSDGTNWMENEKKTRHIHTKFETNQPNLMALSKLRFCCVVLLGLGHGGDGHGIHFFPFTLI